MINRQDAQKKMRDIAIFRNMVEVSNVDGVITILHEDDMRTYNSWFLTQYHDVDAVIYRGESKNLPQEYKSFLEKIGNPSSVMVSRSTKDTY